ncbi:hypothetical protein [Natronorubrum thiooxidans]|uniref:Uncharacterized protein n=1 Tax=Natronorubrum thiooxidans TaxID=308853 RepID=A0A1N7HA08_9EURY|nr:hypothetical protein [Natronorubrum thiooxidans]SIS21724.1 hypothetical protein SAMN05421752_1405 [Natronorubrum thiooxidans]
MSAQSGHTGQQEATETTMSVSNQTTQSNRPQTTPTERSIDLRLTDYPVSIENTDLLEHLFDEYELACDEIAAFVPEPIDADDVRRRLRYETILKPWDDPHILEACYDGYDMSTTEIAETVCDNALTSETVRVRLHTFGILSEKSQKVLEKMDPEDLDLSPAVDDHDPKYLRRGSNGGASA